jgi:hypothetical protein
MSIADPTQFFEKLGDLQDARIASIKWLKSNSELRILVDDVNRAFLGLPEFSCWNCSGLRSVRSCSMYSHFRRGLHTGSRIRRNSGDRC